MGLVPPVEGFLQGLRQVTAESGALLIFDEVMTGFRVHPGGAQTLYNIKPDITALGKVIGGGLPVGAYGGRREIMEMVAPAGPMYQAGTLSGNPLAMTAGIETLKIIQEPGVWEGMEARGVQLLDGLSAAADAAGIPIQPGRVGTMFGFFFAEEPVTDWNSASKSDTDRFAAYFQAMLQRGIYIAPSQFEVGFMSAVHGTEEIEATIAAAAGAFTALAN
jgi:glutamate-1-semialdehyde 2,1-aminomutase